MKFQIFSLWTGQFYKVVVILITVKVSDSGYSGSHLQSTSVRSSLGSSKYSKELPQPKFDDLNIREIIARPAETVLLPCTVWNAGDKVVSWMRKKDLLIISSGIFRFSNDKRFEPVYSPSKNFWGLRIRGVTESDAGQYECQVNTDPKISLPINLTISDENYRSENLKTDRRISIKGPSQVYVHNGSPVVFTCEVSWTEQNQPRSKTNNPKFKHVIKWFHNGFEVSFNSERGGIAIENNSDDYMTTSKLRLASVKDDDVGEYVCSDGISYPVTVTLFVVEGEHSEAMQRDYPHSSSNVIVNNFSIPLFIFLVFLRVILLL